LPDAIESVPASPGRRRSMILVTGGSLTKLEEALRSEADIVCVDFEDTVTVKADAHVLLRAAMAHGHLGEIAVRLNPVTTTEGLQDLVMLAAMPRKPDMLVLTMVVDVFEVELVARIVPGVPIMVIIETAEALEHASALAKASVAVQALWLGGKDLSYALGCDRVLGLEWARGRTVQAAALARITVFDDIYRPFEDLEGLALACAAGRAKGLHAKVTLDARQIPIINSQLS
jgi:citrate lyase subunit beta/citryl-CoA lyase